MARRTAPLLMMVVFGLAFGLLAVLVTAVVVASPVRTSRSPVDVGSQEQWMLLAAVGVIAGTAAFFGALLRSSWRDPGDPELQGKEGKGREKE